MKQSNRLCAVFLLVCALTAPAFAGEMSAGFTSPPPQSETTNDQATDETSSEVFDVVITLLQGVLSVF